MVRPGFRSPSKRNYGENDGRCDVSKLHWFSIGFNDKTRTTGFGSVTVQDKTETADRDRFRRKVPSEGRCEGCDYTRPRAYAGMNKTYKIKMYTIFVSFGRSP